MSNNKKGKEYEDFVSGVYQAILFYEKNENKIGTIELQRNKKITSKSGTPGEIDIYWEYELAGIKNKTAIECKNYKRSVSLEDVRNFARKIENMGLKGLIVTKKWFSVNAVKEASADHIDLITIRESEDKDWDGFYTKINIKMLALLPSRYNKLIPNYDKAWALNNGFKEGDAINYATTNDRIVIEDKVDGFRHSLYELEANDFYEKKGPGQHIWEKKFQDGWIHYDQKIFKINSIRIEYFKPQSLQNEICIDLKKYVFAIMEYINGESKKYAILRSGQKSNIDS